MVCPVFISHRVTHDHKSVAFMQKGHPVEAHYGSADSSSLTSPWRVLDKMKQWLWDADNEYTHAPVSAASAAIERNVATAAVAAEEKPTDEKKGNGPLGGWATLGDADAIKAYLRKM